MESVGLCGGFAVSEGGQFWELEVVDTQKSLEGLSRARGRGQPGREPGLCLGIKGRVPPKAASTTLQIRRRVYLQPELGCNFDGGTLAAHAFKDISEKHSNCPFG
jgi:hypothetical protein